MKRETVLYQILTWSVTLSFTVFFSFLVLSQISDGEDKGTVYQKINEEFSKDNWEEGKAMIDKAKETSGMDSDLYLLSGKYYHHKGDLDKARYDLNLSLRINPDNVDAKQILVNVEMDAKRYSSAICYVNELLEVNPYWKGLWRKKIELYQLQGNDVETNRLRKRINQIYPNDTTLRRDYLYHLENDGYNLYKSGNYTSSIELYNELLLEDKTNADYYLSIVNMYLQNSDDVNAMLYLNKGLRYIPDDEELINKKAGLLAEQGSYDKLLVFLQEKNMSSQYNYYLIEAARYYKNMEPASLYGKVFYNNPRNTEAFNYVFADAVANLQFEEAIHIINVRRSRVGYEKDLAVKEILVYNRMGYDQKAEALTKELFQRFPADTDLREEYVAIKVREARQNMHEELYESAIKNWYEVIEYGDLDMEVIARNAIGTCYIKMDDYVSALNAINELLLIEPNNRQLLLKRADIYYSQKEYDKMISTYETLIETSDDKIKKNYLGNLSDILTPIVKENIEEQKYLVAEHYTDRWLAIDPGNEIALKYAFNIAHHLNDEDKMLEYALLGKELYPNDYFFKLKVLEIKGKRSEFYEPLYQESYTEVNSHPYRTDFISTFSTLTYDYGNYLIKNNDLTTAIDKIDTTLTFAPKDKGLLYLKGHAFEKLKIYDSAYHYQQFYDCVGEECKDFNRHLNYLGFKSKKNILSYQHLRSIDANDRTIRSVSTFEYSRFAKRNTFTGTVNYAGRDDGKGFQLIGQWERSWTERTSTKLNFGWANKYFPKIIANAHIYEQVDIGDGLELELGIGFKKMDDTLSSNVIYKNLYNLVIGATQYVKDFSINARFNNYLIDFNKHLFNFGVQARYHIGTPTHWVAALASVGSAPDQEFLNYEIYKGLETLNITVGAGYSRQVSKNVILGVMGTWINYKALGGIDNFRNIYNLYGNIQIAF